LSRDAWARARRAQCARRRARERAQTSERTLGRPGDERPAVARRVGDNPRQRLADASERAAVPGTRDGERDAGGLNIEEEPLPIGAEHHAGGFTRAYHLTWAGQRYRGAVLLEILEVVDHQVDGIGDLPEIVSHAARCHEP